MKRATALYTQWLMIVFEYRLFEKFAEKTLFLTFFAGDTV